MPTAAVNGVELAYEREGSGPRLLLLNGSGATLAGTGLLRRPFIAAFDVLVHDARGIGRSTVPQAPFTMADCAADALGLADHVGWDRFAVAGISFGGMVAQELAVTAPERVERLALLCTSPGGAGGSSFPLHESPATPLVVDTRFTPEWLAEHRRDAALVDFMDRRAAHPEGSVARRGELAQLEARRHHDVWDRLPRITCPTLVAAGRFDGLAAPANSEAIASRIPNAELRRYDGGHAFFVQDDRAFPDIVAFLQADRQG